MARAETGTLSGMSLIITSLQTHFGPLPITQGTVFLPPERDGGELFASAVRYVLHHEGGYVNDPSDRGGATNWGISLKLARKLSATAFYDFDLDGDGDIDADDIRLMSCEQASQVYAREFWLKQPWRLLPPELALKLFDLGVNMGPSEANKAAQRATRAVDPKGERLFDDGILGPRSMAVIGRLDPDLLLPAIRSEAAGRYRTIIARDRTQSRFESGWLRRAYF